MARDTFVSSTTRALEDHARILPVLESVSRSVRWLDPVAPDPQVFDRVLGQVRSLRVDLQEHFDDEDGSRLHTSLLAALPDAGPEIERLAREHRDTLELIDAAVARALRCSPMHVERLRADLEAVLALLFDHEAVEDQLMARVLEAEKPS